MVDFREAVDLLSDAFVAAFQRGDWAGCGNVYAEDAFYLVGTARFSGPAAIAAHLAEVGGAGYRLDRLTTLEAEADGNTGYAVQVVEGSTGKGSVMLALRRDKAGVWKVCAEAVVGE